MQHQPFSKRPKFQKEAFYEESVYFIGDNPYEKPCIRHMKFWTRTQLNYYAFVLSGRNKIFQHRHIPHVELEEIPCFARVLNILHEAGLLPLCTDICDWNSDIVLPFYATLHIFGDPTDINTWVLDWMTQHTHLKAPANELLVNKKTFEPVEGKGKSVIDEGNRPVDSQFREPDAYSSWDDTETQETPSPVSPRVMTNRELLLSLQEKVDRNHKWVKRQFGAIVKTLNETQNVVKINHHYLHEVFDRTWATLAHLKTPAELEELEFTKDFDWSWPPKKKFKPISVPDLEDSSFSSFRTAEPDEDQEDTATGSRRKPAPKNPHASSSTSKK
ncbi:hypothetical protein ZWY2020_026772 [Hordeum vulgare]|nr:hypothetical protein ZWY2020_026772 [Hordeum vulgare]